MNSSVLALQGTIEELTIYLQLCRKLNLKVTSELILTFENLADKQNFERLTKLLLSYDNVNDNSTKHDARSMELTTTPEPFEKPDLEKIKIHKIETKESTLPPQTKDLNYKHDQTEVKLRVEENKADRGTFATNPIKTRSPVSDTNDTVPTKGPSNQASDEESDLELAELESCAHNLKMVEMIMDESLSSDPVAREEQKTVVAVISGDPIKMKYILLQSNEPRLKTMADKYNCLLSFDVKNPTEISAKGLEGNVNAFQKEFYNYLVSIKMEQLDRTFTIGEFNLLLRSKTLNKIMQEEEVRLISFSYDTRKMFELKKYETIGFLLGESKDAFERVKKCLENVYPKKIMVFYLQNLPPYTAIINETLEEYLRTFYIDKIANYYQKFDQQLGIDLHIREAKNFHQYYLGSYGRKNINKEIEHVALTKIRDIFVLTFTVLPAANEKISYDDGFWKICNEFSQKILKMGFALKCKLNGMNGGLLFALVGKVHQYSEHIFPRVFEKLPLFQNKLSEGKLIVKSLSNVDPASSLMPKTKDVTVTLDIKESYLQYNLAGATKEVLETANVVCNAYYIMLKNESLSRKPRDNKEQRQSEKSMGKIQETEETTMISRGSIGSTVTSKGSRQKDPNDGLQQPKREEESENLFTQRSQKLHLENFEHEFRHESHKNVEKLDSTMATRIEHIETAQLRQIELLGESPIKLGPTSEESAAVRDLLKVKFGCESPSAIVIKFSSKLLWENYCRVRNNWLTTFGNPRESEQPETELIAQIALEQEDLEKYCSDASEFNAVIRLRDHISNEQITQEPVVIRGKNYHVFTIFLAFLPLFKKAGVAYLMTGGYAAYPMYFVFIPA